jgi:hypothetical protein
MQKRRIYLMPERAKPDGTRHPAYRDRRTSEGYYFDGRRKFQLAKGAMG